VCDRLQHGFRKASGYIRIRRHHDVPYNRTEKRAR
jgi:hypothetical protein